MIAKNIGAIDLVKTEVNLIVLASNFGVIIIFLFFSIQEFPVHEKTLETCLYAIIGVLGRSKVTFKLLICI